MQPCLIHLHAISLVATLQPIYAFAVERLDALPDIELAEYMLQVRPKGRHRE